MFGDLRWFKQQTAADQGRVLAIAVGAVVVGWWATEVAVDLARWSRTADRPQRSAYEVGYDLAVRMGISEEERDACAHSFVEMVEAAATE